MEQLPGESRSDFVKRRRAANEEAMNADLDRIRRSGEAVRAAIADSRERTRAEQEVVHEEMRTNREKIEEITEVHKKLLGS